MMRSSVWHFMERESPDPEQKLCWQAMNPGYQGKGLIEGTYLDYLVDDVLSSDFKFNPESNGHSDADINFIITHEVGNYFVVNN